MPHSSFVDGARGTERSRRKQRIFWKRMEENPFLERCPIARTSSSSVAPGCQRRKKRTAFFYRLPFSASSKNGCAELENTEMEMKPEEEEEERGKLGDRNDDDRGTMKGVG